MQAYLDQVADPTEGDHERFLNVKQPVYIHHNVYAAGASPYEAEKNATILTDTQARAEIVDEGQQVYLKTLLPAAFDNIRPPVVTGADLEPVRFVDAEFEEPDGSPATPTTDLTGHHKSVTRPYPAGPLAALTSGRQRVRVW
jgi:hypothetical protein